MSRLTGVLCVVLLGCGGAEERSAEPAPEPASESASQTGEAAPRSETEPTGETARADGARCLPVVAEECGCVYGCAGGTPTGEGAFEVTHERWTERLSARVEHWCVEDECTEAFFVELVCDGICAPRRADPTCGFRAGACVTGRSEAMIEGTYRVFWAREGEQVGALSLLVDGRYMYTGRPQPGDRRFYFVDHPHGRYALEMRTDALSTAALEDHAIVATLRLDPEDEGFDPTDPRRSLLIRWDEQRSVLYAHSLVSEFETWRIERSE